METSCHFCHSNSGSSEGFRGWPEATGASEGDSQVQGSLGRWHRVSGREKTEWSLSSKQQGLSLSILITILLGRTVPPFAPRLWCGASPRPLGPATDHEGDLCQQGTHSMVLTPAWPPGHPSSSRADPSGPIFQQGTLLCLRFSRTPPPRSLPCFSFP